MTDLKPCPFCGGEAYFQAQQGDNPEPFAWDVVHHCAADGFIRMNPRDSKYRSTKAEAAAAWNTRAADDTLRAEVERLREALTEIERIYLTECDADWRAAQMSAYATIELMDSAARATPACQTGSAAETTCEDEG